MRGGVQSRNLNLLLGCTKDGSYMQAGFRLFVKKDNGELVLLLLQQALCSQFKMNIPIFCYRSIPICGVETSLVRN